MKIIESPREGMQGFSRIILTGDKVRYIDKLLQVGFDTVETGSFVSARIIPQMADSLDVLERLSLQGQAIHSNVTTPSETAEDPSPKIIRPKGKTNLMLLAVNGRGAEKLAGVKSITHISYPFSFSPTFLHHNVNATVEQSLATVHQVIDLCKKNEKTAVIYISMAFGNPYGDPWNIGLLVEWTGKLYEAGARIIPLSNVATEIDATLISRVFETLINNFPDVEFGLHLHTANQGWFEKVDAAWMAGCRRFDGVINGWGGCPMAAREMLGNLKTENLIDFAFRKGIHLELDRDKLFEAYAVASEIFASE